MKLHPLHSSITVMRADVKETPVRTESRRAQAVLKRVDSVPNGTGFGVELWVVPSLRVDHSVGLRFNGVPTETSDDTSA